MDIVEGETTLARLQLARDEVAQFVTLIAHLVQVLVSPLLQAIQEALLLEFIQALLQELTGQFVTFLAQPKLSFDLSD